MYCKMVFDLSAKSDESTSLKVRDGLFIFWICPKQVDLVQGSHWPTLLS